MKLVINSLPKSGTHLLGRLINLLGFFEREPGLAGGLLRKTSINPLRNYMVHCRRTNDIKNGFNIDLDIPENLIHKNRLHAYLSSINMGEYLKGHLPFGDELNIFLQIHGFKIIHIYRDPRDVLVSLANYHRRDFKPFHDKFTKATTEGQIAMALHGLNKGETTLAPLSLRLERSFGWINAPGVHPVKFEELIGEHGGGSKEAQRRALVNILKYLDINISLIQEEYILEQIYDIESETFYKGKIKQWADAISDSQLELVNSEIGEWVDTYGYSHTYK